MVKEIVEKMGARDCSYPLDAVVLPWRSSHTIIGEEVLQKIIRWLSPPDPSTNYVIGLRNLHQETSTWFLDGRIFQEWHSTGSLLWVHGKRTFLKPNFYLSLTGPSFIAGSGKSILWFVLPIISLSIAVSRPRPALRLFSISYHYRMAEEPLWRISTLILEMKIRRIVTTSCLPCSSNLPLTLFLVAT